MISFYITKTNKYPKWFFYSTVYKHFLFMQALTHFKSPLTPTTAYNRSILMTKLLYEV